LQPVQDYRNLNKLTILNRYPLPLTLDLIHRLRGAKLFTKLDVRWGYNNVRIREGDEWKAAFITHEGLFEPTVMFFGLCNSPATFQGMMDDIFRSLIIAGLVLVYIDDILIYGGRNVEEHRRIVREVLLLLRKHHLYLKPEKCDFEKLKVEYLGMIIGENTVAMDPVKVQAVAEWPVPTCKKDIQVFLGFTNFYRRFIKDYAKMAKPLSKLTGKEEWEWTDSQQQGFESLINAFTHGPVLTMAKDDGKFKIEIDASGYACGGVLMQYQDKHWRTIAFRSSTMNETE